MTENSIDDLSDIGTNPQQHYQEVDELDDIYPFLGIQKEEGVDEMSSQLIHLPMVSSESELTLRLRTILKYTKGMQHANLGQFLSRKYKNLLRCMLLQQSTLVQDYSLLFEILFTACKKCTNCKQFMNQLEAATAKSPQILIQTYMIIVFTLVKVKLTQKDVHSWEINILKECCKRDKSKNFAKFMIEIIVRNDIRALHQFYFLKEMFSEKQQAQKNGRKQADFVQNQFLKLQTYDSQKPVQQTQVLTPQGSTLASETPILTPQSPLSLPQILQKAMKSVEQGSKLDRQVYSAIKQVSIIGIKRLEDSKRCVIMLLKLSFTYVDLLNNSLEAALYVLEVQQLIQKMKELFTTNSNNNQIQKIKKIVRAQLKKYSKDGDYFWSKICPPSQ